MQYKYLNFSSLDPLIQYTYSQITNLYYTVLQKRGTLVQDFIEQKCINEIFQDENFSHVWKKLTVADMLSRTFTKAQLQLHQLRHKQLPLQNDFSIMKDNQLKPVH